MEVVADCVEDNAPLEAGIKAVDISLISVLCGVSFWLCIAVIGGVALLLRPGPLVPAGLAGATAGRLVGAAFVAVAVRLRSSLSAQLASPSAAELALIG